MLITVEMSPKDANSFFGQVYVSTKNKITTVYSLSSSIMSIHAADWRSRKSFTACSVRSRWFALAGRARMADHSRSAIILSSAVRDSGMVS
jgi:hypothetical protein